MEKNNIVILGDERLVKVLSIQEQQSLIEIVDKLAVNGIELKPEYLNASPDPQSPCKTTITIDELPSFKVGLTGQDIKEGKLSKDIQQNLPFLNDTDQIFLICKPIAIRKENT